MTSKINELADKIYHEGVEKAELEAKNILSNAKEKAAQIVAEAEQKAQQTIQDATKKNQTDVCWHPGRITACCQPGCCPDKTKKSWIAY